MMIEKVPLMDRYANWLVAEFVSDYWNWGDMESCSDDENCLTCKDLPPFDLSFSFF